MGGYVRVVVYAAGLGEAEDALAAAFAEVAAVDAAMSDYNPDSELSRLSRSAGGPAVAVSPPLFEVLAAAEEFSRLSDGAFDVTVGPVVDLWRRARKEGRLPEAGALRAAMDGVGFRHVELDAATRSVRLARAGMRLDLGGIAQGYACDRALAALTRRGLRRALVDAAGDIAVGDPPPGRDGWRIRVGDDRGRLLVVANCGVTSSGDAERFVEIDGRRYSHVVDPRTGMGLEHVSLVTVVARDGLSADALATAVSVLGPVRGLALAEDLPEVEAWMRWRPPPGEGAVREGDTGGFARLLADSQQYSSFKQP